MSDWSLPGLLAGLHDDVEGQLELARKAFHHSGTKGDASEGVWRQLLSTYLPVRYQVTKAHVVDSFGKFSDQIDIVIYDRQYSPFIFRLGEQSIVPAECVYAVFEAKQSIDAAQVEYAAAKAASVRRLHRTSQPIPHAGGVYPAKSAPPILAGLVTLASDWNPPLGTPLRDALERQDAGGRLDLGCVAAHGLFAREASGYVLDERGKAATPFLFELIARLQAMATVPMLDVRAYAKWLGK